MKNTNTTGVVIRMLVLPIIGFFPWLTVILAKYNLVKLPVREIAALKGTCISLYVFIINDYVKKYVMEMTCKCYHSKRHELSNLEDGAGINYVDLDLHSMGAELPTQLEIQNNCIS